MTVDYGPVPPISAEPGRLGQVFLNLLVNALHALPDDGTAQVIHVSTSTRADGQAVIEIADSGVGIAPGLLPAVFDPFVTTKPVGKGTGLGLSICRSIVMDLGGEIALVPRQPSGTIARVVLPPAAHQTSSVLQAGRRASTPDRPGVRLLIADDEDMVRQMLARLLRHYDVTTVADGVDALREIATGVYDVILCDLMMPGCNGVEVWKGAREIGSEDRLVLMTGGVTNDALRDFIDRNRVPIVEKPATLARIEAAIDACLAGRRLGGSSQQAVEPA